LSLANSPQALVAAKVSKKYRKGSTVPETYAQQYEEFYRAKPESN